MEFDQQAIRPLAIRFGRQRRTLTGLLDPVKQSLCLSLDLVQRPAATLDDVELGRIGGAIDREGFRMDLRLAQAGDYDVIVLPLKVAGHEGAPARAIVRQRGGSQ